MTQRLLFILKGKWMKLEFTCLGLSESPLEALHFSSLFPGLCSSNAALDLYTQTSTPNRTSSLWSVICFYVKKFFTHVITAFSITKVPLNATMKSSSIIQYSFYVLSYLNCNRDDTYCWPACPCWHSERSPNWAAYRWTGGPARWPCRNCGPRRCPRLAHL